MGPSIRLSKAGVVFSPLHPTSLTGETKAAEWVDWTSHPRDIREWTIQSRASVAVVLVILEKRHVAAWNYRRKAGAVNQNSTEEMSEAGG